jgi:hypothetical protein
MIPTNLRIIKNSSKCDYLKALIAQVLLIG